MTEYGMAPGRKPRERKARSGKAVREVARELYRAPRRSAKAGPRAFRLDPEQLARAREILGTPNDTATIEAALDMVVFASELRAGVEALGGFTFAPLDEPR